MLNEIAVGDETVALVILTAAELECLDNPEESTHLNEHASARQKIQDAAERLAQTQTGNESQREDEPIERDRAFLKRFASHVIELGDDD